MASHSAILSIKILTDAKDAAKGMEQASTGMDKFRGRVSAAAKVATGVLVGLGAAAFAFGKAAAEDAQGAAILAQALKNTTGATKDQVSAVEDWISKTALATGVADDQLRPALGTLARATGSVEESQKGLSQALDISAATGKDVNSVAEALAKGYAGNTTSLGRLVPGIDKATLASGNMKKIMRELADQTGGSMAAAADTAQGRMKRMQVAMDETKESLGAALLPLMGQLATILGKVAIFAQNNSKAFTVIIGVIAAVAAAIVILNAALTVQKAILAISEAQWVATWAAAALPVVLVIAAIAAVVAIFVILYKKSATFRNFVDAMWKAIKVGALAVVNAIRPAFAVLFSALKVYVQVWWAYLKLVFNLIKGAVQLVVAIFKGDWKGALTAVRGIVAAFGSFFRSLFNLLPGPVRSALSAIWQIIAGAFRLARDAAAKAIGGIRTAIGGIKSAVQTAMNGLASILSAPFHAAESAVKSLIGWVSDLLDKISNIHIPGSGLLSHIPGMRAAPAVGPAYTGDPALGAFMTRPAATGTASTSTTGGGPTIIVNGALDPEAVARQIRSILAGHDRRMGLAGKAIG